MLRKYGSVGAWDTDELDKVRHMLGRGKSPEFIRDYTGMPLDTIQKVANPLRKDGRRRGGDNLPGFASRYDGPPIAPCRDEERRIRDASDNLGRAMRAALA